MDFSEPYIDYKNLILIGMRFGNFLLFKLLN